MTLLFISGEIVILANFKGVLGEKEENSLPAHDHYLPKKNNTKFYLIRFPTTKIESH